MDVIVFQNALATGRGAVHKSGIRGDVHMVHVGVLLLLLLLQQQLLLLGVHGVKMVRLVGLVGVEGRLVWHGRHGGNATLGARLGLVLRLTAPSVEDVDGDDDDDNDDGGGHGDDEGEGRVGRVELVVRRVGSTAPI